MRDALVHCDDVDVAVQEGITQNDTANTTCDWLVSHPRTSDRVANLEMDHVPKLHQVDSDNFFSWVSETSSRATSARVVLTR